MANRVNHRRGEDRRFIFSSRGKYWGFPEKCFKEIVNRDARRRAKKAIKLENYESLILAWDYSRLIDWY